jgi:hypothetical protein
LIFKTNIFKKLKINRGGITMKDCPACGFKHSPDENLSAEICRAWAHLYSVHESVPTKEQYEAMQIEGFLPKQEIMPPGSGRLVDLPFGFPGSMDRNWVIVSERIKEANTAINGY